MSFTSEHLAGHPDLARRAYEIAGAVFNGRHTGDEFRATCPFHADERPSLDVNVAKAVHKCQPCGAGGDAVDFYSKLQGVTAERAIAELREKLGIPKNGGRPAPPPSVISTKRWEIRNAAGELVAVHVRNDFSDGTKTMPWERNGATGLGGLPTAELPLYGSELVKAWEPEATIALVEGEKAADALRGREVCALATVTGAKGTPDEAALEVLRGRDVLLWPDLDDVGRAHMERIAAKLVGIARAVRVLSLGEKPGDDAVDFFERGGTLEQLDSLLAEAPELGRTPEIPAVAIPAPPDPAQPEPRRGSSPSLVRLDTIKPERVTWLWPRRIPFGKITMADGDPGLGKSTVVLDLVARVTRGRELPDGAPCEAGNVLILSAEDGLADTIRPRVDAAGGDSARITVLEAVKRPDGKLDLFSLSDDIEILRSAVEQVRPKVVVIDPFSAYIGGKVDSHKDQEIRRVLAPLAQIGNDLGPAILLVRHLNKGKAETAIYRGGGSIGIIGAARSGLFFIKDPDDETGTRILIATYKSNLSKPGSTLAYHVEGSPQDLDVAVIVWDEITDPRNAEKILAASGETLDQRSQRGDARAFLREFLADGDQPAKDVIAEAKGLGIAEKTLRRAFADVGQARKPDFASAWVWRLK